MSPVVVGIDPGTSCGWAVLHAATGDRVASGTWDLAARRHEGGGMRFVRFEGFLQQLLRTYPVKAVLYEEVRRHMGVDAAHVYGGIVATLGRVCEGAVTPYAGVPVGTVKKRATGKGNAAKGQMIEAAQARWGVPVRLTDDDEADALWIAETWRKDHA